MTLESWTTRRLRELFIDSKTRGKPGLPTLSVTMNDGLVSRDTLDRKMETNLQPDQHLLVRKGDLAYNMMRMWQGASGLAAIDGMVSPAYVVLRAGPDIDPLFASYLFKHPRMVYLFWAYSHGMTEDRLRLYFDDFGLIPISVPPIEVQRQIAEILLTWDKAIEKIDALIANARKQKKGLMQSLLTSKNRLPGFAAEWINSTLGDAASIIVSNVDKKSDTSERPVRLCNYTDVYRLERIQADGSFMAATATDAQIRKFGLRAGDVLITKDSETPSDIAIPSLVTSTAPDLVCGYHLAIIRPKNGVDGQFLKYVIEHPHTRNYFASRANGATRFGLTTGTIETAPIALPCYTEQKRIGELISAVELEAEHLESVGFALRKEKTALIQQLLTGKRRVKAIEREVA